MTQLKARWPWASLLFVVILSSLALAYFAGCKSQPSDSWEADFSVTTKDFNTKKPLANVEVNYICHSIGGGRDSLSLSGVADSSGTAALMGSYVEADSLIFSFKSCTKARYKLHQPPTGTYNSSATPGRPSAAVTIYMERG